MKIIKKGVYTHCCALRIPCHCMLN